MKFLRVAVALFATLSATAALAQNPGAITNHAFAIGQGAGKSGFTSLLCGSAQLAVGQAAADPICRSLSGDASLAATGVITFTTVNSNVGSFGSATQCPAFTVNAKGLITAASQATCTPAIGSITGLGANCATFLATPTSANLRACLTDESGTGLAYFQGGDLGTPSAGVGTNLTALNASNLGSGTVPAARTNGHQNGTATNDNAAAGEIGELLTGTAAPALTTNTPANCGQVSLTAGDWDVYAWSLFSGAGATVTSDVRLGINSVSATLPAAAPFQFFEFRNAAGITDFLFAPSLGPFRVSLTATTTYYCVAQATFVTSTFGANGGIRARRAR